MKTNKRKYDDYVAIAKARSDEYIRSLFPDGLPKELYEIAGYKLRKLTVIGALYDLKRPYINSKRVTNANVDAVRKIAERVCGPDFTFEKESVFIDCEGTDGRLVFGVAKRLTDIGGKRLAWTAEELEPEIQRLKELYEPREGHTACQYCARQCPTEKMFRGTIISRMWKNTNFTSPERLYCDQKCRSHDQMSHEG